MKKLLIYDIAAEAGGAKTILDSFYNQLYLDDDEVYVVTSVLHYPNNRNIKNIQIPWTKKTWIHRVICDCVVMPFFLKKEKINEVISLQNTCIPFAGIKQTVYIHNVLPFTEYRFSFFSDKRLWVYQNVIGPIIAHSIVRADAVIVQTEWMRDLLCEKLHVEKDKFQINKVNIDLTEEYSISERHSRFIYPASPVSFKNHKLILDACIQLRNEGITNYEVFFTFNETENKLARNISDVIKREQLPITFIGRIPYDELKKYYCNSVLLFPSFIETVGLPLIEAKKYSAPEIVIDCPYARFSVGENEKVYWFDAEDSKQLAEHMKKFIDKKCLLRLIS